MVVVRNLIALFSKRDRTAQRVYDRCVAAARAPEHYGSDGAPDTVDGRFGLLVLHLFLASDRLRRIGREGDALVQALIDCFVRDMDKNLREMGAGDVGVAKNVKRMAEALNGQLRAYHAAAGGGPEALRESLVRNVLAGGATAGAEAAGAAARRLAGYAVAQRRHLAAMPDAELLAGRLPLRPVAEAYADGEREGRDA